MEHLLCSVPNTCLGFGDKVLRQTQVSQLNEDMD